MCIVWIALWSYLLSSVIDVWVQISGLPQALFGMLLIAIGAEIPDTIESVTMARKGCGTLCYSSICCSLHYYIHMGVHCSGTAVWQYQTVKELK